MRFTIHRLETCASTNDVARDLALGGAPEGTIVVAAEQTAGRGTKGRGWHSLRGKGLYISILLRPATGAISLFPLLAGVAARDAVERVSGLEARLRWPNDIVFAERKLGGVLCESRVRGRRPDYVVVGLGLNVNHDSGDFPEDVRPGATSLRIALGKPVPTEALAARFLEKVDLWYGRFSADGQGLIVRAFEASSVHRRGQPLSVLADDRILSGTFDGIDEDGALRLRLEAGVLRLASAEIQKVL